MIKVGIAYDIKTEGVTPREGDPSDLYAEFDSPEIIDNIESAIKKGGYEAEKVGNVFELLSRLCARENNFDVIFNLCEGLKGRNRESEAPVIMEMMNIPFIGSDGLTLGITLDKVMAKKILAHDGINTPKFFVARSAADIPKKIALKFPLIVKPRFEGSSKGITQDSLVRDRKALVKQVDKITSTYRQPAIVEEFISGTEFTVGIIGNEDFLIFEPVQIMINGDVFLGEKYYLQDYLGAKASELEYVCPPKIPARLKAGLQKAALACYSSMGCRDFGRVDFRVDEKSNIYALEVNPLPSLSTLDVFGIVPDVMNTTYDRLVASIIDCGVKRLGIKKKKGSENLESAPA